jgi:hypothetical protein
MKYWHPPTACVIIVNYFLCVTVKVYTNPYIFDTRVYEIYTYMYKQTKQLTLFIFVYTHSATVLNINKTYVNNMKYWHSHLPLGQYNSVSILKIN